VISRPIRRGWDFGLTPACTFSQMLPSGQWIVFDEVVGNSIGIENFLKQVIPYSNEKYGQFKFIDYGDPAGNSRSQTDERTCFSIMRASGIEISAGEQTPALRLEAVRRPLSQMISGQPAFILHPRCKTLRKGFMGGYHYKKVVNAGRERIENVPDKNEYSHIHDALQYDASRLFGAGLKKRSDSKFTKPINYRKYLNFVR